MYFTSSIADDIRVPLQINVVMLQPRRFTLFLFILIYFISRSREIYLSHLSYFYPFFLPISGAVTRKGLTTPFTRRVASIRYLCVGVVYVVLPGSPSGSITLVSSLREIPTVAMLHRPFLFGEIPT